MDPVKLEKDFDYAMLPTRLLLLPLGLWSAKSKIYQRFLRPIVIAICLLFMLFVIIPMCLFVVLVAKNLKMRLKLFGPLGLNLMNLIKYVMMIYKKDQVAEFIRSMWLDWREVRDMEERQIMMNNAKSGRLYVIACVLLTYGGGMPFITILPFSKGTVLLGNESLRQLPYPCHFVFFNAQVRPIYDYVFAIHCVCAFIEYTITCGVNSIVVLCIMHICSQITITHKMLNKLVEDFDNQSLGKIIRLHQRLLKLASKLEEIFNKICLFEVFSSSCIISFLGYYLITEYENRDAITLTIHSLLLFSLVFNIFILCYIGEMLTEQCKSIGHAAYMTDWYHLPHRKAKNIVLLIIASQSPVYLTAGKIFNLSILSFSNFIKAAASYLQIWKSIITFFI